VSGAVLEGDDSVGSSHDADVDAAYDDDQPATDAAAGSDDVDAISGLGGPDDGQGAGGDSHAADVDAGYDT